tara:strand:- start:642 stop:1571 length:930 start_codon:yes stop_codon:yes gene_type:complete
MSRAWFKFYGRDYRDGVRDLPFDVVGIYSVLLTYMYEEEGGRIKDHDQRLARLVGCDIRMWKRARSVLIEAGKLSVTDGGFLTNARVEIEVKSAELLSDVRAKSGRSSRQLRDSDAPKSLKTESPPEANASILPLYARASSESESDKDTSLRSVSLGASKPSKPKRAKAARELIPLEMPMPDWAQAFASERGFVNGTASELWTHFTAYHASKGTLSASIQGHWRTWVQNQVKFRGEQHGNRFGSASANSVRHGSGARGERRSAATIIMESALADSLEPDPAGSLFGEPDADTEPFGGSVPRRVGGVGAG